MKRKFLPLFTAIAAILLLLPACSGSEPADARDLLGTVPSDATAVSVVNLRSMLEKLGCKVDGNEVKPSKEISEIDLQNDFLQEIAKAFFKGDSGIQPSALVLFQEGYYKYMAGVAYNPKDFKETFGKALNDDFRTEGKVEVCKNVAVSGNMFWISLGQNNIDARDVEHFCSLSDSQSFLSLKISEKLCEVSDDFEGWLNIAGAMNSSGIPFQTRAVARVALETMFSDAQDLIFSADFLKGKAEIEAEVYNSKGKHAKYQFSTDKINLQDLDKITGSADILIAAAIPNKLIRKLQKDVSGNRASVLGMYLSLLSTLDGTSAAALDILNGTYSALISTNGKENASLMEQLRLLPNQNVVLDGSEIILNKGTLEGSRPVKDLIPYLKDAVAGGVACGKDLQNDSKNLLELAAFTLHPEDGSLKLEVLLCGNNPDENFLISLLKSR